MQYLLDVLIAMVLFSMLLDAAVHHEVYTRTVYQGVIAQLHNMEFNPA